MTARSGQSGAVDLPDGWTLRRFDTVESTMDVARDLAGQGAAHGTVVVAGRQTGGRGRRGRAWESSPGNLYASIILRPGMPAARTAQLAFVAGLAVFEAARSVLPGHVAVACKWPNDLLVDGRKAAGILLESEGDGRQVHCLIVGIGINLAHHPEGGDYPATDLGAVAGAPPPVASVLARLCMTLHMWYERWCLEGFGPVCDAWLASAHGLGGPVVARLPGGERRGIFAGLAEDGALLLRTAAGEVERIGACDVFPAVSRG